MFNINNLSSKSKNKKNNTETQYISREEWIASFEKYPDLARKWNSFAAELVEEIQLFFLKILEDDIKGIDQDKLNSVDVDSNLRIIELYRILEDVTNGALTKEFKPMFDTALKIFKK